ncbi:hypothetical protein BHE74_00058936 [Ensete ventricosum]|uniref:Uncharacterized protein n=1 Tax=Ensete ventricosum TaxID=4639 RepID=A0A426YPC9_ENSVE|nr:hypothetical protein B296_00049763 [Ensete ventricosum]RWW36070.1 hypothetical protein BHE74_00058936 [Ensete ventricosum]
MTIATTMEVADSSNDIVDGDVGSGGSFRGVCWWRRKLRSSLAMVEGTILEARTKSIGGGGRSSARVDGSGSHGRGFY